MQIIIDGKEAAIKQGSSFDFIAENRMFSGSDSFTLSITFPLKDCFQNLEIFGHVNRSELPVGDYVFDCEIRDKSFSRFGTLAIVEISDIDVKAQFLEGRAEQNFANNFDEIFINELDLGMYPSPAPSEITPRQAWAPGTTRMQAVALPWVSAESGVAHNFAEYSTATGEYNWCADVKALSWQPFLLHIVRKICDAVGYTYDLSVWENDNILSSLLICNTLPDSWELSGFARALPHWTVTEFFERLELFMRGEFSIDHRARHISFGFFHEILEDTPAVSLETVVDEYSSSIDTEGDKCEYLESKAFKFSDRSTKIWKYMSCDWLLKSLAEDDIVQYPDFNAMSEANSGLLAYDDRGGSHRHPGGTNLSKILYTEDDDTYYILRNISRDESGKDDSGRTTYKYMRVFQPINEFGAYLPEGEDIEDAEELKFVPACVDFTEEKFGNVLFLDFSSYDEPAAAPSSTGDPMGILTSIDDDRFIKTMMQSLIESGEKDSPSEYYDVINLGLYRGYYKPGMICPSVSVVSGDDFFNGRMRINNGSDPRWRIYHRIDRTRKVTFKFLADNIPDPRALFYILGRRYICEKITATFTEDGMSQLLKGEFWPLLDD